MENTPEIKEEIIAETENAATKKSKKENVPVQNYASMGVTEEELDYYKKKFENLQTVQSLRVHCTSCNKHLGSAINKQDTRFEHPLLKVLVCEKCYDFYTSGDFEKDEDGSELYCRWCGQGGVVYCCAKCPFVFCKRCIKRNMGQGMINYIEANDDWVCYACRPKDIWMHRSMYRALKDFSEQILNEDHVNSPQVIELDVDYSGCCKSKPNSVKSKSETKSTKDSSGKILKVVLEKTSLKRSGSPSSKEAGNKKPKLIAPNPIEAGTHSILGDILSVNESDNSDEVVCTPDILNMNDSPPNSPQVDLPPNLLKEVDTSDLAPNLLTEVDLNDVKPRKYVQVKPVSQLIQQAVSPNSGPTPPSFQAAFQQNLQKSTDPVHPVVNNMIKSLQSKLKVVASDGTILYLPAQLSPQSGRQTLTTQVMTLTAPQMQTYIQTQPQLVTRSTPQLVSSTQASPSFVQPRIPTQMQFSQSKTQLPQPIRPQGSQQYTPLRPISINNSAPQTWFDTAILETQTVTQFINTQVNQLINAQKQTIQADSLYDYFQTKLQFCLDKVADVKRNLEINYCLSKGEPLPKRSETFNKSQNTSYQSYKARKSNERNANSLQSTSNTPKIILNKNAHDLRNSNLKEKPLLRYNNSKKSYRNITRSELMRKGKNLEPTVQSDGLFDMDVTCDETSDDEKKRGGEQKEVEIVEIMSDSSDSSVEEISDNEEADPMWVPDTNFPVVIINENGHTDEDKNSTDEDEVDAFHNIGNDDEGSTKNSDDDNIVDEEDTIKTSENGKDGNGDDENEAKNSDNDNNSNNGINVKNSDDENNTTKNSSADDDNIENSDNENNTSKNSGVDEKLENSDSENNTTKNSGVDDKIENSDNEISGADEDGKKDKSKGNKSQSEVDKELSNVSNSKNSHVKKKESITPSDMLLIAHALRESMKDQTKEPQKRKNMKDQTKGPQKRKKSADDLEKLLSSNVVYRNNDQSDSEDDKTSKNEDDEVDRQNDQNDEENEILSNKSEGSQKDREKTHENNKNKTFGDAFSTFISKPADEENKQNSEDEQQEQANNQSDDKKSASETNDLNCKSYNSVSSPPPLSNEDLESEIRVLQKMTEDYIAGSIDTEDSGNKVAESTVHENSKDTGNSANTDCLANDTIEENVDKIGEKKECDISVNIDETIGKNDSIVESIA